jgi:hypothetical protein
MLVDLYHAAYFKWIINLQTKVVNVFVIYNSQHPTFALQIFFMIS